MLSEAIHSKGKPLSPKDLSQSSEDAAKTVIVAALVASRNATQNHAQHASQPCCINAAALLSLTQQGEEAGGDSGEDAAHRVGGHTRLLRDFANHRR